MTINYTEELDRIRNVLPCRYCGKSFLTSYGKYAHIKKYHDNMRHRY